ncbi:hypothetical protein UA08_09286 [Talaromyces atroroseus]|uniref:Carboxylic ester hydrolase n=1 Tax=Talaromyces atroroseus TaxID=1441469 RepID=A0A1Q5Q6C9_TALAT|nr:hypothetical protein UA08_09286 [Talaromyces atroroseus]OKL55405.1 hypothetical protein UA08_09286 [Talaromyces atroroseus]
MQFMQQHLPKPAIPPMSDMDGSSLNITAPVKKAAVLLPGLVFIHGGGYLFGTSSQPPYGQRKIVQRSIHLDQQVVAININYRLGVTGFLISRDMQNAGYKANLGLRDQQAALVWIQKYIEGFGGDPDRVTVIGQSAGAEPGDFVSVPPKVLHKPTPLGPITHAVNLISPADWVDFFRGFKDDYNGTMFPEFDDRDRLQYLTGRLPPDYEERFDTYFEEVKNPAEPSEWTKENEVLPDDTRPYYLRHNTGPRWMLGPMVSRPFITTKQSGGRLAIPSITSSALLGRSVFDKSFIFPTSNHLLLILDGTLEVRINSKEPTEAHTGEVVFLPAGTCFALDFRPRYVRCYSYVNGDGIEALIHGAGDPVEGLALPEQPQVADEDKVLSVAQNLDMEEE